MTVDYTRPPQPAPLPPQGTPAPKKSSCGTIALIGCAVILVAGAAIVAGIVYFVFGLIKNTEAYRQAANRAMTNPEVIARLGQPIEVGWWVTGSVTINDESGTAKFSFPIRGPKDEAKVHVEATRERDRWVYSVLRVKPDKSPEIDLLAAP